MSYHKEKKLKGEQVSDGPVCRKCKSPTAWQTLSDFGGQCYACYADYCREQPKPKPKIVVDRKTVGDTVYTAEALKAAALSGMRLTPAQKDILKSCENRLHPSDIEQ